MLTAPHGGGAQNGLATPAPRHDGTIAGAMVPRPPSLNETDVSDKPPAVRNQPLLTPAQIADLDYEYQTRLEAQQTVDEGSGRIVEALADRGVSWRTRTSCSPPTTGTTSASTDSSTGSSRCARRTPFKGEEPFPPVP